MKKSQQKQPAVMPVVMDATGRGDHDATGRGSFLGTMPIADPTTVVRNQTSLRPMSGGVDTGQKMVAGPMAAAEGSQIEETFGSLFDGENLSEEFKTKASVIFEAAVNEKITAISEQLAQENAVIMEQQLTKTVNELATRLDEYLNYVVEEWMKDNKLAVESGIRTEIAESFISGLRNLFESHYIEVPDKKHDVLEDLFNENQKLEDALNEQIKSNVNLNKEITAGKARTVFLESVSDLSQVDAERLASLAESIEFSTAEDFQNKILILKENYLKAAPVVAREPVTLTEQRSYPVAEPTTNNDPMSVYVNALSRQTKTY